jgi:hypothetical protein
MSWRWYFAALFTIAACSDNGGGNRPDSGRPGSNTDGSIATDASSIDATSSMDASAADALVSMDAQVAGNIPEPPMSPADEWADREPNDTPDQAVPVGMIQYALWMGFSQPTTMINRTDDVDYFVFRTGADASAFMSICWGGSRNLLDMALYEVQNNTQGALVRRADTTNDQCETLIGMGETGVLQANSVYLLEVRAAPGLSLAGTDGMYSA